MNNYRAREQTTPDRPFLAYHGGCVGLLELARYGTGTRVRLARSRGRVLQRVRVQGRQGGVGEGWQTGHGGLGGWELGKLAQGGGVQMAALPTQAAKVRGYVTTQVCRYALGRWPEMHRIVDQGSPLKIVPRLQPSPASDTLTLKQNTHTPHIHTHPDIHPLPLAI